MKTASVPLCTMPPQNVPMEIEVLGACMLDRPTADDVVAILRAEDFYRDWHGQVFSAIRDLVLAGEPVDPLAVQDQMAKRGTPAKLDEINDLVNKTPHHAGAAYHAGRVREKAVAREILRIAEEARARAYEDCDSADSQLEQVTNDLLRLAQAGTSSKVRDAEQMLRIVEAEMAARMGGKPMGLASGIDELDDVTGGFGGGNLIVIAARPSMGKTALAVQIAGESAIRQRQPTLFFSLEMDVRELMERLWSMRSGVLSERMQAPWHLDHGDTARLADARPSISESPLWADDSFARGPAAISATARSYAAHHGLKCVLIDYLQLIQGEKAGGKSGANRQEQVAEISRSLKGLAKDLDIPVIVLSQLNRESEKRADKRPFMSDLRESGAIEQDADKVILLHRPEYYDVNDKPGVAEAIIAKNRSGRVGTVELRWVAGLTRFESPSTVLNTAEQRAFDEPY